MKSSEQPKNQLSNRKSNSTALRFVKNVKAEQYGKVDKASLQYVRIEAHAESFEDQQQNYLYGVH